MFAAPSGRSRWEDAGNRAEPNRRVGPFANRSDGIRGAPTRSRARGGSGGVVAKRMRSARAVPGVAAEEGSLRTSVVAGVLALAVAMGIGRFAFTPILPAMRDAFGLSTAALGALASANYLGYLIGALGTAVLPAGRAQAVALRGGLMVVVAVTGAMALTTSVPAWLGLRFVAGLASAAVFVAASSALLALLARRGRPDLAGWFYGGVGVGIAASGLVVLGAGQVAPGSGAAWRVEWVAVAVLAAALAGPCWFWLPRPRPASSAVAPPWIEAKPGGAAALVLLGGAYLLEGTGYIVAGTFLVAIVDALPAGSDLGRHAWILVGLAAAPSTLLWSRLAARFGFVPALVIAFGAQAAGLALPVASGRPWAAAAAAALFGGTFVGITLLTIAYGRSLVAPARTTLAIGGLTALFGVGQVVGPLLAAALVGAASDFRPALLAAAGLVTAGGGLVLATGWAAGRRGAMARVRSR